MLYKYALGQAIREARLNSGLTQRQLSKKSFISFSYLSEVERGLKEIGSSFLESLAPSLGVEAYELVIEAGYIMSGLKVPDTIAELDEYADLVVRS